MNDLPEGGATTSTMSGGEEPAATVEETGAGGLQMDVSSRGVRFIADEPVLAGGLGSGPNPFDLLCAALGACTAMTLRMYARRKGWPLAKVRVRVGHVPATPTSQDRFTRRIELRGDLTDEERTRLIDVSKRCPVHVALERGSRVETIEEPAAPSPR